MAIIKQSCRQNDSSVLATIRNAELLKIKSDDGESFGCDQDWYEDSWQQRAGCGPCTASSILLYLAHSNPLLGGLYPEESASREHFSRFMHTIWSHVTPGIMGVNEGQILIDGLSGYAREQNIRLEAEQLKIPGHRQPRPEWPQVVDFIIAGLDKDCPVAFLNLSNGELANLDSWHWVTITALLGSAAGDTCAVISDSGEKKIINFRQWYESTLLGGSLVTVSRAVPYGLSQQ